MSEKIEKLPPEKMSRREVLKELQEGTRRMGLHCISKLRKHEAARLLLAFRKYEELDGGALSPMKRGAIGPRPIPTEEVNGVIVPSVPPRHDTRDARKARRYVADAIEDGGVVTFKD